MDRLRALGVVACVAGVAGALLSQCAEPTAIRVSVLSEVPCAANAPVVLLGAPGGDGGPLAAAQRCEAKDALASRGTVVLVPESGKDGEVRFAVATRPDGAPADRCLDPGQASGCIVAKRQLRFVPGRTLDLRIDLRLSCLGVVCADGETCARGACVPALVPAACTAPCDEDDLGPPPDAGASDAGVPDADAGAPGPAWPPKLTAGTAHTCKVHPSGGVECWGDDTQGQLGLGSVPNADGGPTYRTTRAFVPGLSNIRSVIAGAQHTCAVRDDGEMFCWGGNDYGQLGIGSTTSQRTPALVLGQVAQATAGNTHTCILTRTPGQIRCWGAGTSGALGDGAMSRNAPGASVVLPGTPNMVWGGEAHTCATLVSGAAFCWGANDYGQVGNGLTAASSFMPTPVLGVVDAVHTLASDHIHSCALRRDGRVSCWGNNSYGQMGDGTTTQRLSPVDVTGVTDAVALAVGYKHACVLGRTGAVRCWGWNNYGELGDGTTAMRLTPVTVVGLPGPAVELAAGHTHNCVRLANDDIWCWGSNDLGQLGNGTTGMSPVPVKLQ